MQLADESLYFSEIETNTIVLEKEDSTNADSFVQENNNDIKDKIIIDKDQSENLTYHPEKCRESNSTSNKPKRELPKASTLGAMFKEIHQDVAVVKEENKVELTTENLPTIWKEFLEVNKNTLQNAFLSVAQTQIPQLVEDRITFVLSNNISLELLQLHKMDITAYFRKVTTSTTVIPYFQLKKDETQQKSYKTPKDRLKEMIDENPAVLKLIEKFDLNMD